MRMLDRHIDLFAAFTNDGAAVCSAAAEAERQ